MVNLTKKNNTWSVSGEGKAFDNFSSIETAAHFLMHYFKVKDEAIDDALIEMLLLGRSRAIFNADGELESTVEA